LFCQLAQKKKAWSFTEWENSMKLNWLRRRYFNMMWRLGIKFGASASYLNVVRDVPGFPVPKRTVYDTG